MRKQVAATRKIYCKVFGERNSGTHFLADCLTRNFIFKKLGDAEIPNAALRPELFSGLENTSALAEMREMIAELEHRRTLSSDFGWKHAAPPLGEMRRAEFSRETLFVFLVKDPVSWLVSLFKRDYHNLTVKPASVIEFVNSKWVLRPRDNLGVGYLSSPVCLWNEKLRQYRAAIMEFHRQSVLIRYEDLLTDYEAQMEAVAEFLLKKPGISKYTYKAKSTKLDPLTYADYQNKYASRKHESSAELLDAIDRFLDSPLASSFGYTTKEWRSHP